VKVQYTLGTSRLRIDPRSLSVLSDSKFLNEIYERRVDRQ
jgi:hypothetical protein